jgi:hypothetical protein
VRSQARRRVGPLLIKIFPDLELDGNKIDSAGDKAKDLLYRYSFLYEDQNSECNNNSRAEQRARNARYCKNECIVRVSHFRYPKTLPIFSINLYAHMYPFDLAPPILYRSDL